MIKNIKNEMCKIYKSNRFVVFSTILILVSIVMGAALRFVEKQGAFPPETISMVTGGAFVLQVLSVISDMVLPIFATLLVCFLIIDEYNNGTLKLPLLCGYKRVIVLLSKVAAVFVTMFVLMLVSYLSATATGVVIWGSEEVLSTAMESFVVFMETYLSMISWSVIMFVFALFIHNSGIMIGIVSVLLVVSSLVTGLFPEASKMFVTYYFKAFASMSDVHSILFGIGICIEGIVIFGMLAFGRFNQMEISR
jgi:ABC-type transport system involved in multi-copper enzyme maturation permease subunit